MTTSCYKITDPDTVTAYVEAEAHLQDWNTRAKEFTDTLPGVHGFTRRGGFTGEHSGLILTLASGTDPKDLPGGWRYVKTRGTVEPKLHAAGEYARELYAPFQDPPHQPVTVLQDAKVPTFVFEGERSMYSTAGHFHHDGTLYLSYGFPVSEKELQHSGLMESTRESEYVLAREAAVEARG